MTQETCLRCALRNDVAQRPGFLWRVGHMFAERGINIDQIAVYRTDAQHTVMVVCFAANAQQLIHLQRRLQRFDGVLDLTVLPQQRLDVVCRADE